MSLLQLGVPHSLAAASIVAQGRFVDLGRRFRPGAELDVRSVLIMLGVLGVVGVVTVLLLRYSNAAEGRPFYSRRRLFTQLCRVHHLDSNHRWLLRRLARAHGLEHPGQLFLEPGYFAAQGLSSALAPYQQELAALRNRLFGDLSNGGQQGAATEPAPLDETAAPRPV